MNTCKDCKHWSVGEDYVTGATVGSCGSEKFIDANTGGRCPKDGLRYWDHESYSCGFETGPDFGCIHWEAK